MSSLTPVHLVVKAGACMRNGGDGSICALQPKDCPADATFVTPRHLDQAGGGLAHGGACTTRTGTEVTTQIGWCAKEGCTGDASACRDPSSFTPVDDRCTIRVDDTRGGNETLFGLCEADSSCYWSSDDCQSDPSSWVAAYDDVSSTDRKCTCDRVRVGACWDAGYYYCAVAPDSCDDGSEWVDAVTLQTRADSPNCFLCQGQSSTPLGGSAVDTPSPISTPQPTAAPVFATPSVTVTRSGGEGLNQPAVVLGATLGSFLGLVLLSVSVFYMRHRRISRDGAMKEDSDLPSQSPTITQIHVDYDQEDEYVSDIEA